MDVEIATASAQAIADLAQTNFIFQALLLFVAGFWLGQWLFRR